MQCIRCGKTIADGRLFCETCAEKVSTPLEEAEARRLVLPDRSRIPAAPKPVKKTEPTPPTRGQRRLTAWVVILSLLCVVLMGAVGYSVYFYYNEEAVRERGRMVLIAEENVRLNAELDRTQDALDVALEEQQILEDARQADAQKILRLEDELQIYQMQTGDLETDMTAMEEENIRLINELDRLMTTNRELTRSVESLEEQMQQTQEQTAYLAAMETFFHTHVAFVCDDDTGYYHRYGCEYFHTDMIYWVYGVNTAVERGYAPCPYCS